MKVGKTGLKMSSGEVRHFKSKGARERFERVAQAVKHGWKPTGKMRKSVKGSEPFSDAELTKGYRSLGTGFTQKPKTKGSGIVSASPEHMPALKTGGTTAGK